jgi:hypothetical protein
LYAVRHLDRILAVPFCPLPSAFCLISSNNLNE